MNMKPFYFDRVQADARRRWQQLEADPELAGPWHQLFKQVQSPRHVLSELLQNADDAGATEAKVDIVDDVFVFEHNGEDFTAEHFASLCRFGYSNKRALHTIGFRGIGFKSTFSLGDRVELQTPTLSVFFARERFTLPVWMNRLVRTGEKTQVRVPMQNLELRTQLERNFEEWKRDHISLLFFKHVRRLQIGEHEVRWENLGPGPAPASEWMALNDDHDNPVLLVRSAPIPFPPEAIDEIRQERLLTADEDIELPPTTVDIVLGATGRMYVVLPTGVETELPFACNAPFVQDPARFKIKEPEVSPTNRWLLRRAGELAASTMLAWLQRTDLSVWARCDAYNLLPNPNYGNLTIEDACEEIVIQKFSKVITEKPVLLTCTGQLVGFGACVAFPSKLFNVWSPATLSAQFDPNNRIPLSHTVSTANVRKLVRWGLIREIQLANVLKMLEESRPPKPESWSRLLALWALVGSETSSYRHRVDLEHICIMPVEGQDRLFAANEVSRIGEGRLFDTEQDWRFLAQHVLVLDRDWLRFLSALQRNEAETTKPSSSLQVATRLLKDANLAASSVAATVVQNAAKRFFASGYQTLADCVRLTQIAAKFKVVGDDIKFVTRNLAPRSVSDHVLVDHWGPLDSLLPADYLDAHLLHPAYTATYSACSRDEWNQWIESGRSRLNTLPPIAEVFSRRFYSVDELRRHARQLSPTWSADHFPYKTGRHYPYQYYLCEDFDFPKNITEQWDAAASDDHCWRQLATLLLNASRLDFSSSANVRFLQSTTNGGNVGEIKGPPIPAAWIRRLQNVDCLPDTRGFYHKPADLMRRTRETESLLDVEPFIDSRLDTEANRQLLDLLGVRSEPTGPEQLLNRVRTLTKADAPPLAELEKWYRRLDQMAYAGSTDMLETIKEAFATEALILAEDGSWNAAPHIFISADETNLPGVPTTHARFRDLQLWPKVGVAARPTFERVLGWLKDLPSDEKLTSVDLSRTQPLLARYPHEIWHQCGHWLNLAGEWVPIARLTYALTMQSLTPWEHLFLTTKYRTADLRRLNVEATTQSPFSDLALLATAIENRLDMKGLALRGAAEVKPWIRDVAHNLKHVRIENPETTAFVRTLADELSLTTWQVVTNIAMIPYIDGTPVGTSIEADVVWSGQVFYVTPLNEGRLAKVVPNELRKAFGVPEISRALDTCYDRSTQFINSYFAENFTLEQAEETDVQHDEEVPVQGESTGLGIVVPDIHAVIDIGNNEVDDGDGIQFGGSQGEEIPTRYDATLDGATSILEGTVTDDPAGTIQEDIRDVPSPQPPQPTLMERFAAAYGYRRNSDRRFHHADGSWFEQADGRRPVWEKYHGDGRLLGTYWVKDHCLERTPLQIDAADWALITAAPATHQLILVDLDGHPIEVPGTQLLARVNSGQVTIYPDTYRLEYNHDHP